LAQEDRSGSSSLGMASSPPDCAEMSNGMAAKSKPQCKAKQEREEMPQPPGRWIWLSYSILLFYFLVALEGFRVTWLHPWRSTLALDHTALDAAALDRVRSGQLHLCAIYVVEVLLALGPGWCAMSPGWTVSELVAHHVPYVLAVAFAFAFGHAERWSAPMAFVLLTPCNEGLFIATGLGAPAFLHKVRRLYGFSCILGLFTCELWNMLRNDYIHWEMGSAAWIPLLSDQIVWFGIYYHGQLLRMYLKRWRKKGEL